MCDVVSGLVPDVIAGGNHVDAGIEELVADLRGDAEAAGSVLAVDDDEIGRQFLAQRRYLAQDRLAPGPPHYVAQVQDSQRVPFSRSAARRSR